jgi:proteic killer suppression protein
MRVELSKQAEKALRKIPRYIALNLAEWVQAVELEGVEKVRKIPGYHDEVLQGRRKGQRSIRLSLAYRAIYEMRKDGKIEFVSIEEVNKHEY